MRILHFYLSHFVIGVCRKKEDFKMSRESYLRFVFGTLSLLTWLTPNAFADNGTVVTGSVIGIDPINQIMRVYVTAVNGQALYGSPQTNYVDYLVSPNTVVIGPNNQFVNQANVFVGSQIQMQFAGSYASTIVLLGNSSFNGYATSTNVSRNYGSTYAQSYLPIQTQTIVHRYVPYQNHIYQNHVQNHVLNNQHLAHPHQSMHPHVGITLVHPTMTHHR